ncbi:hypothetical protein JL720_4049 [Aureococcus anophagefferens]|nr:hypothetical protein JL720_4049 [Aureococcus anophagefferens]
MRVVALLLGALAGSDAFYLPGVAPRTFRYGDKARTRAARRRPPPPRPPRAQVELKVNKLTSVHTQIPYDYYSLKFCRPRGGIKRATENLGEFLGGDLIENSPFQLFMEQDQFCKVLCQVDLAKSDYIITAYAGGFPVGYQDHKASYLFNHVNIIVEYHPLDDGSRVSDKVHWFSIINSLLIVLFLSVMVAMILVRNLHRDIVRYNRTLTDEEKAEDREESGWKLVHADVFRPPASCPMLFCVACGTGVQVLLCTTICIVFAAAGFLSPANRGSLATAVLVLFVMMGAPAGYTAATLYKTFKGRLWQKCTLYTAFAYPGVCFVTFLSFDGMLYSYGSTGAVPLLSLLSLLALWFGVSVPLVFLGAYLGFKREPLSYPVITVFGFTALVFVILIVTCCEITIVLCYFQLCSENYHWWWRAFLTSGSTALYVLLYSCVYFGRLAADEWFTYVLYFGYMILISLGLFALTGACGFFACLWFTKKIYASIKVD